MEQKYSVIELAELVGVPRTTINDWLSKYSSYIEFTIQGKRRIYTENTLMVLKTVQELRNQGISCADIEARLSTQFAVHPVPQEDLLKLTQERGENTPDPTAEKPAGAAERMAEEIQTQNQNHEYALIARQHSEEIARAVSDRFQEMFEKVGQMEKDSRKTSRRIHMILGGTVLV